jgi:catechol 2,3-dioxygenase
MTTVIKPALHHVTIKTSRLNEMIAWYAVVVGAQVQFKDKFAAWVTNDAANHRIGFLAVPGLEDDAQKIRHNGMHHSAFEYASFADLMSSFDRLRKEGIEPAFCLDHGLTISLYYKDPDGNFVELQSDNFSDWKLSSEWMRTSPDFAQNPIGTFFDPARVYDEFKSGADFKTLQKAIRGGAYLPHPIPEIGLPTP